jgi:hypothetical protein
VTSQDPGRTIATLGHISHDADACAGVVPEHGGKSGFEGCADYADYALAADTVAVRTGLFAEYADFTLTPDTNPAGFVTPKDTSRTIATLGHISHDADACAGVVPSHGGKPGAGRCAEYADSTLTSDTVTARAAVTEDAGRWAIWHLPHDAVASTGRKAEYASFTLARDTAAVTGIRFTEYAGCGLALDTVADRAVVSPPDAGRKAIFRVPMNTESRSRVMPQHSGNVVWSGNLSNYLFISHGFTS